VRKTLSTYEQQFNRSTSQKLADIRKRSAAKYSNDGKRLLKPAVEVEITLPEFRAWTLEQFGHPGGSRHCYYGCGRWLTPITFVPDHYKALDRGGRNHTSNLVACCETCNDIKGVIDGPWFEFFNKCLEQMPEEQRSIIRSRLAKSEKLASSVRNLRGRMSRFTNTEQAKEAVDGSKNHFLPKA
jgi:hypothetical protein